VRLRSRGLRVEASRDVGMLTSAGKPALACPALSLSRLSSLIDRIREPRNPAKLEHGQQKAKQGQREADRN
jgi:hypothetical protein